MYIKTFFFLIFISVVLNVNASNQLLCVQDSMVSNEIELTDSIPAEKLVQRKNVRIKAILFTVLTGPLGGHRVYLRTRPGAPIIYAVTLGGFGILPLVDLAHLIFKKDISTFEENPKIMMWTK